MAIVPAERMTDTANGLFRLPNELLLSIAVLNPSINDILRLSQTCRKLYHLIRVNAEFLTSKSLAHVTRCTSETEKLAQVLAPLQLADAQHMLELGPVTPARKLEILIARSCEVACEQYSEEMRRRPFRDSDNFPGLSDSERERFLRSFLQTWAVGVVYQRTGRNLDISRMSLKEIACMSNIVDFYSHHGGEYDPDPLDSLSYALPGLSNDRAESYLRHLKFGAKQPFNAFHRCLCDFDNVIRNALFYKRASLGFHGLFWPYFKNRNWWDLFLDERQGRLLYHCPPDNVAAELMSGNLSWTNYGKQLEAEYDCTIAEGSHGPPSTRN